MDWGTSSSQRVRKHRPMALGVALIVIGLVPCCQSGGGKTSSGDRKEPEEDEKKIQEDRKEPSSNEEIPDNCALTVPRGQRALVPLDSLALPYSSDSVVHLGSNFDALESDKIKKPALNWTGIESDVEGVDKGVRDLVYEVELVRDYSSLYRASGYDVRASLKSFFASGSASVTGRQSSRFSSDKITFVVKSSADYGRFHLKHPELNEDAKNLWENEKSRFRDVYGTHVAIMERRKASIYAIADFTMKMVEDASSTAAAFSAKASFLVGSGGVSASAFSTTQETKGGFTVNVQFFAQGGGGISHAAKLAPTDELAAAITKQDVNMALRAVISGVNNYAESVSAETAPATEYFAVPILDFVSATDRSMAKELARVQEAQMRAAEGIAVLRERLDLPNVVETAPSNEATQTESASGGSSAAPTLKECRDFYKVYSDAITCKDYDKKCLDAESKKKNDAKSRVFGDCSPVLGRAASAQAFADIEFLRRHFDYERGRWLLESCEVPGKPPSDGKTSKEPGSSAMTVEERLRTTASEQCSDCRENSFDRWQMWFQDKRNAPFAL